MKKIFPLLLCAILLLCACSQPQQTDDVLDLFFSVRYQGKTENMTRLAPQEFWDWSASQGRSVEDVIAYAQGAYNGWLGQFGSDLHVSYTVLREEALDDALLQDIAQALHKQYDIDTDAITAGRKLTVKLTVKGSQLQDTTQNDYILITVHGTEYVVMVDDENGSFTVTFRM